MLTQLPEIPVPEWLMSLLPSKIVNDPFPLDLVLQNSLYYPACGFDGDPVKYLAGNVLSFINVDYSHTRDEFLTALKEPGFYGYDLLATRPIKKEELVPNGWQPTPPNPTDGNPSSSDRWMKEPFCHWAVFQRNENFPANHGPARFSLLYLCADGVAAFQALYIANSAAPKIVAIIQPGTGFGGNWTNFTNPQKILARSILQNPTGSPDILLDGGNKGTGFYQETWALSQGWGSIVLIFALP